jgi:hypothetical protein
MEREPQAKSKFDQLLEQNKKEELSEEDKKEALNEVLNFEE